MTESNSKHNDPQPQTPDTETVDIPVGEMDPASRSLSEALGVSFIILQVIMLIVVVAFLASGFKTIGPDEQALVLRFGRLCDINDVGADPYVRGEGLIWTFPYPIDQVIRIPVEEKVRFETRSFWYFEKPEDVLGAGPRGLAPAGPKLNPVRDGYTLVRGEGVEQLLEGTTAQVELGGDGSDYNLVHSKWQVVFEIGDISRFFRNIHVEDPQPGDVYFDLIKKSATPLIKNVVEDAVVDVLVSFSIDDVIASSGRIPRMVTEAAQAKLNRIESGIRLVSVTVNEVQVPRQVREAFNALHTAQQERETRVKDAETYKKTQLNETCGEVAEELAAALEKATTSERELDLLWRQVKGDVSAQITAAETYRSQVVEEAQANANYFKSLLVQYRERPQLVVDNLYLDMMAKVLAQAQEKILLQPHQGKDKEREIRIMLNRDATLKNREGQNPDTN